MIRALFYLLTSKTYCYIKTKDGLVFISKFRTKNDYERISNFLIDEKERNHLKGKCKSCIKFCTINNITFKSSLNQEKDLDRVIDFILTEEKRNLYKGI